IFGRAQVLSGRGADRLAPLDGHETRAFGNLYLTCPELNFRLPRREAFDQTLQNLYLGDHLRNPLVSRASDLFKALTQLQSLGLGAEQILGDFPCLTANQTHFVASGAVSLALRKSEVGKSTAEKHPTGQERRGDRGYDRHVFWHQQREGSGEHKIRNNNYGV
ncbi:MAG: hypothetical protein ACKVJT_07800, partial [Alphaproteobacteria bacterium]